MESITERAEVHEIGAEQVQSLYEMLRQVPDYRHQRGRRYEAATVLVILRLAKLAGESTVSGIAHWAHVLLIVAGAAFILGAWIDFIEDRVAVLTRGRKGTPGGE